jgi:hypothetical protein
MNRGKRYLVSGNGKSVSGSSKWFNHGLSGRASWATYVTCDTFQHALRQFKRTPYRRVRVRGIRRHGTQIDLRGRGIKPKVLYAYRYDAR